MIYKDLAEQAYEEYFRKTESEDGLLNEIVSRIAQEKELNYEEVSRVCQYLNTKIFLKLYKSTNDKTIEFDVADPGSIKLVREEPEKKPEFSDEDFMVMPKHKSELPKIDFRELMALKHKLENRLDDANAFLREEKPVIVKRLASRFSNEDPQIVVIAVKSVNGPDSLLKSAAERAGVKLANIRYDLEAEEYEVDHDDVLLKKIAEYSKIKKERDELEKMAFGVSSAVNAIMSTQRFRSLGEPSKQAKTQILSNQAAPNEFNIKNPPRQMPPGDRGYLGGIQ